MVCKQKVCKPHRAVQETCIDCFLSVQKSLEMAASPRDGMSFRDLYYAARKLIPEGYLSVSVTLNDHESVTMTAEDWFHPRIAKCYEWNIYHADHGHSCGNTPEAALLNLKARLGLVGESKIDV